MSSKELLIKEIRNYIEQNSIADIIKFLTKANDAYRNNSETLVSDDFYDYVRDYAYRAEPNHPFFKMVGAPVQNKELLPVWMGSLDKIRDNPKELTKWMSKYEEPYVVSEKLDGNSGLFAINKDNTYELFTRGDGTYGRNISSYIKYFNKDFKFDKLSSVTNSNKKYPLLVRGELILSKKGWETVKTYGGSNARNVIAGTLNAKTPDERIAKHLHFVAYELIEPQMPFVEGLEFIKKLGFNVVYHRIISSNEMNSTSLSEYLIERRKNSAYEIDGIVIRDNKIHKVIKEKNPKHAFAFKSILTHESAEVIVLNIVWNVSKDGLIKPTVEFTPVFINNVKIKQATGFNAAFIEKHTIGVGSKISIIRSGDVIPHIREILSPSETGKPDMPSIPYEWSDTHVDIRIIQDGKNDQMNIKQMEHFVKNLEIDHVGSGILKKMYANGIDTIPKLLSIRKEDLLMLDGIKDKSAEKIHASIKSAFQKSDCMKLMVASNIFGKGLGSTKLELIVESHPEILDKKLLSSMNKIPGIGPATEKYFLENLPDFYAFLDTIGYVCPSKNTSPARSQSSRASSKKSLIFEGMTIVFTGFRDKELGEKIKKLGGKNGASISKNTNIVVVGNNKDDTTKLGKARELGITIMEVDVFKKKYKL